ncbi:MAG: DUF1559 domain-containing protein [Planctomycetaceae bacterium]|mgnify:CR=1 FL=1|jgi:hypothetical protein|nr:DUF1559 domain-containing protein [Planctomycetaceae bacterium]MBT6483258.1 DUF1559 domain-containing protein [Planctomycetaceae bacterium]MBT6494585.1 DUF1559 domain-containing protein [Planctomycetaceae bacterium]
MRIFVWISAVLVGSVGCESEVHVDRDADSANASIEPDIPSSVVNPPVQNPFQVSPADPTRSAENEQGIDTNYLLSDTRAVLVVHPDRIFDADIFKNIFENVAAPLRVNPSVAARKLFEIAPADVRQAIIAFYPKAATPGAVILRFHEPYAVDAIHQAKFWRVFGYQNVHHGQTYYTTFEPNRAAGQVEPESTTPSLCFIDGRTILAGYESMIVQMISAKNERSPLIDVVETMDSGHAAVWVSHGVVSNELFAGFFESRSTYGLLQQAFGDVDEKTLKDERFNRIPKSLWDFGEVVERQDSVLTMTIDVDPQIQVHANLDVTDEDIAQKAVTGSNKAMRFTRGRLREIRGSLESRLAPMAGRLEVTALDELLKTPVKLSQPNSVSLDLNGSKALSSLIIAYFTAVARKARNAAQGAESQNHLKSIGLGLHNYHEEFGHFPPAGNKDKQGKLLLSWRVHLLPEIGEKELYKEFHLDEPWNSEHNLPLVQRIPKVYQLPSRTPDGTTNYLGAAGKGALFDHPTGARFRDVIDSLSKTFAVVLVADNAAVPWTKPVDHVFDPEMPAKGLGTQFRDSYNAAMVDASVRRFESTIDPDQLRALFTIDTGD